MTEKFKVSGRAAGTRLDTFLRAERPSLSRRAVKQACDTGALTVNGRRARPGLTVAEGDRVELAAVPSRISARPELRAALPEQPEVLFEDEHLLVLNKPRAVHTITLTHEDPPTLADWLAGYLPATLDASPDPREAGLVQRLDYYTTGALLAAKDRRSWELLRKLLSEERLDKSYLAFVHGSPEQQEWECTLRIYAPRGKPAVQTVDDVRPGSHPARTKFQVVGSYEGMSIVRAWAHSARRHQVRAHLAASGHPLVGDTQYGAGEDSVQLGDERISGFLLHAEKLRFTHPHSGEQVECAAPSKEFAALLT